MSNPGGATHGMGCVTRVVWDAGAAGMAGDPDEPGVLAEVGRLLEHAPGCMEEQLLLAIASVCRSFEASQAGIWLWSADEGFTVLPYGHTSVWDLAFLNAGQGVCVDGDPVLHCFERGEILAIEDATLELRFARLQRYARVQAFRGVVFLPLIHEGRPLGVVSLHFEQARGFTVSELALLEVIARQIGAAVYVARLALELAPLRSAEAEPSAPAGADREGLAPFLAELGQELRTPIQAISALASLMAEDRHTLSARQAACVRRILAWSEALGGLADDLLEPTGVVEAPALLDLADLVHEATGMVGPLMDRKPLTLTLRVTPGLPPVHADRRRVRQLLLAMLGNAIQLTPARGSVAVAVRRHGAGLRCAVHDGGPGSQARGFGRWAHPGIELGVQRNPGKGSACWFSLPLQPV